MGEKDQDTTAAWQSAMAEMSKGFAAFAQQAMTSPEFSKMAHQVGDATTEAQQRFREMMQAYLAGLNLPTRAEMDGVSERLASLERRLDELSARLDRERR